MFSTDSRLLGAVLAGLVLTGTATATDKAAAEGTARPAERDQLSAYLFELRPAVAGMRADAAKASVELSASELPAMGTGGGGGGSNGDLDSLARFLRSSVSQSYNQTYEDAYRILRSGARSALEIMPDMPAAMSACLRGALRGAAKADTYKDGWTQLHATMRKLGQDPYVFAQGGFPALAASLYLARQSSWEQSFRNAYYLVRYYSESLLERPELFQGLPVYHLAVRSARAAGAKSDEYDDGWRTIDRSLGVLASSHPGAGLSVYYRAALQGSYENSYRNAYFDLLIWARRLLQSGMLGDFDQMTVASMVRSAEASSTYEGGYRILRNGMQSLR